MNPYVGIITSIEPGPPDPVGTIDVRGIRIRIPLLLTPGATVGDSILIDAGVAVAVLERRTEGPHHRPTKE